jgi:hypothetical protein
MGTSIYQQRGIIMNRLFSTLAVLAMMLIADAICVGETLSARQALGENVTAALLVLEGVVGLGIIVGSVILLRRHYVREIAATHRGRFEVGQQLRRLLSTVWF